MSKSKNKGLIKQNQAYRKWRKKLKRKNKQYDPNKNVQIKKEAVKRDLATIKSGFIIDFLRHHSKTFPDQLSDNTRKNGHLFVPETFSLIENEKESFRFLYDLFYLLYNDFTSTIVIDFEKCNNIDPDASVCLDLIVGEFIKYFRACRIRKVPKKIQNIKVLNYSNESIKRVLFSIGAFTNLKDFKINFPDVVPYRLKVGDNKNGDPEAKEIEITELVDYIRTCLKRMRKDLTQKALRDFSQIIGEVLTNAEEHSTTPYRYSIGYFQEFNTSEHHYGYIKLVILNFGDTIYEKFKGPNCENIEVKKRMEELSKKYTRKGLFTAREFEEETLWTLYSLQEGVTSTNEKRGNGSIRFIESFFNLKGTGDKADKESKLKLMSGNSRIIFNGSYPITKIKKDNGESFQVMTFNENSNIENKPDKNFVNFVSHFFPGTILTARIVIDDEDLKNLNDD